jgi:cytochrome P450
VLGVPYSDLADFQRTAHRLATADTTPEDRAKSASELIDMLTRLVANKVDEPTEVLVSELAQRVKDNEIPVQEAAFLAVGLLVAGHETTANMIGLGTVALLQHPEQLTILRDADDPKVVANAVEELLRYLSIVQQGQRCVALDDIEIAGQHIRAGEGIILDLSPANWDERVFPEPERLDLRRPARDHVAFGFGPHQCVGQQLARAELQIVLPTLFRRVPSLRVAVPLDKVAFNYREQAFGVYTLPVEW